MMSNSVFANWRKSFSTKNRFYIIIVLILCVVAVEFGSLFLTMQIMSGTRVYVAAESIYSKTQKSSYISLLKYVANSNEADYQQFLYLMDKGPITSVRFRAALDGPRPDVKLARNILFYYWDSDNISDFNDQIFLYQYFRDVPPVHKVMQNWFNGNLLIPSMMEAGEQIHTLISAPYDKTNIEEKNKRDAELSILNQRASDINDKYNMLEKQFTLQMGQLSVLIKNGLIWFNVGLSLILALFVIYIAFILQRISTQTEKDKNDFIRIANHQLNTPFSIMKNAHAMVQDKSLPLKKGFDYMAQGLTRAISVFEDIKTVLQFEGETKYDIKSHNLKAVMQEAISYAQKTIGTNKKDIKINVQPLAFPIPHVMADLKQLNNALYNLLDNAVYYTQQGSIKVSYQMPDPKHISVSIQDTGIGFTEEDRERLGQKFYRSKKALLTHPDGSGLGLYIARTTLEHQKGQLFFESEGVDKGSTFGFVLPVAKS